MDADTRLREALTELADQVDRSSDPWQEHERRMAARTRTRRGWTVAAAAACVLVVAALVTPLLLDREPPQVTVVPIADDPAGFQRVVDYVNGGYNTISVSVERGARDTVCVRETTHQTPGGEELQRNEPGCEDVRVPDDGPARINPRPFPFCDTGDPNAITDCAMHTGVVVVVTEPEVDRMEVETSDGRFATAREVVRTSSYALFAADFPAGSAAASSLDRQRMTYTARAGDGQVIDEVTLGG